MLQKYFGSAFFKQYSLYAKWAAKILASFVVITFAFSLINAKDTGLPLIGLGVMLLLIIAWGCWFIEHIIPFGKRREWWMVACLALLLTLTGSGCTRVDPGYVGIQVYYYGAYRGEPIERGAGTIWYLPFYSTVLEYPVFQRQTAWTHKETEGRKGVDDSLTYNSKEGMVFHADVSIAYTLRSHCVGEFYRRFRTDHLDEFTHGFLRQSAQNHANGIGSNYTAEELYGDKKNEFILLVQRALNAEFRSLCVEIVQMGYTEAPRPPGPIVDSINRKTQAVQDAITSENQLRQSRADAQKKIAEAEGQAQSLLRVAEAQAKANALLSSSLTPALVQLKFIEKWNGIRPTTEIGGGGTGAGVLLNINPNK